MPIEIGATTHSFSEPTGLLSDCHRRVEMFMSVLQSVAAASNLPLSNDFRTSLDLALRYFREAAPRHTADEEQSLFPRLRRIESPEMQNALRNLEALEEDHRWAEPLHKIVNQLGMKYLNEGSLSPADSNSFRDAVDRLAAMYRGHIEIEERDVFPVAARLLSKQEQEAIACEMAARRNAKPVAGLKRTTST